MPSLSEIRAQSTWGQIIEGQPQHALMATLLTLGAFSLLVDPAGAPRLLGLTAVGWAKACIVLALVHQIIVALGFRLELHRALLTRIFGDADMRVWAAIFMPLLAVRPLTLILTGWADSVPITGYRTAEVVLGLMLLAPAIWGMHSTLKYFTLRRAFGGDHFREEIRALPKVTGGVFDYTDNGMYGVVFLGLWGVALVFGSWNALVVALFQHAYIWVHMYCTEAPDLRRMYGSL